MKAPAAARALPKLAERARAEEWSYERFAQALLATETSARDAHGGEARIRAARFPARKTLEEFAAFCGQLTVGWRILEAKDPESKGALERTHRFLRTNFEPARRFANHVDFQGQLDRWFSERANVRFHRGIRAIPARRLISELQSMRALPERMPPSELRSVIRVPQQPYLRFDTNDYSLDPSLVGRRVEVRASQRQITAHALDSGELACRTSAASPDTARSQRSSTRAR